MFAFSYLFIGLQEMVWKVQQFESRETHESESYFRLSRYAFLRPRTIFWSSSSSAIWGWTYFPVSFTLKLCPVTIPWGSSLRKGSGWRLSTTPISLKAIDTLRSRKKRLFKKVYLPVGPLVHLFYMVINSQTTEYEQDIIKRAYGLWSRT